MVFQAVIPGHQLKPEGSPEPVLCLHGVFQVPALFLRARAKQVTEISHLQGGDIRLEDQLGYIGRSRAALEQFILDMLHLAGSPIPLPDGLRPRQLPPDEPQHPGMMQGHGAVSLHVQVHGIAGRQSEIRIIQVGHQFLRRLDSLGPVQHKQPLEASRQQHIHIQRLVQPVFLTADHHQRQGAAVKPGPPKGVGQLLFDAVACFQAA